MKRTKKAVNVEKNKETIEQNKVKAEKRSNRELVMAELRTQPLTKMNMMPDGVVMFPMTASTVDLLMKIMQVVNINHSPTESIQSMIKTDGDGNYIMGENGMPLYEERYVKDIPLITRLVNDLSQKLDLPIAKAIDEGVILPTNVTEQAWEAFYTKNQEVIDKLNKGDKDALVQEIDVEDFAKGIDEGTITDYPTNPIEELGKGEAAAALETAYKGE